MNRALKKESAAFAGRFLIAAVEAQKRMPDARLRKAAVRKPGRSVHP